jgi:hypothetical protein
MSTGFSCQLCNKFFTRADNILRHMRTVHNIGHSESQSETDSKLSENESISDQNSIKDNDENSVRDDELDSEESSYKSDDDGSHISDEDEMISERTLEQLESLLSIADVDILNLTKRQIRDFVYKNENYDDVSDLDFDDEDEVINPDSIYMLKTVIKTANEGNFNISTRFLNTTLNNLKAE